MAPDRLQYTSAAAEPPLILASMLLVPQNFLGIHAERQLQAQHRPKRFPKIRQELAIMYVVSPRNSNWIS